jgi:hypothetical protein
MLKYATHVVLNMLELKMSILKACEYVICFDIEIQN